MTQLLLHTSACEELVWMGLLIHQAITTGVVGTQLWEEWWAYEGVSGPDFWGTFNNNWSLCNTGKFQSPVNIEPNHLVYDPNLSSLTFDFKKVNGTLVNTGHDLTFEIHDSKTSLNFLFSGGSLSYSYQLCNMKMHFGSSDEMGSEHLIAGKQFPFELQIMGYNKDLYKNYTEASMSTHGLAVISILGVLDKMINTEFEKILLAAKSVRFRGSRKVIEDVSIGDIIPDTDVYITYEGSLTQPSCQETVTWIIMNKPLRITRTQMLALRDLNGWSMESNSFIPLVANNFRPPKHLNRRPIRTNIKPRLESDECTRTIKKSYKSKTSLFEILNVRNAAYCNYAENEKIFQLKISIYAISMESNFSKLTENYSVYDNSRMSWKCLVSQLLHRQLAAFGATSADIQNIICVMYSIFLHYVIPNLNSENNSVYVVMTTTLTLLYSSNNLLDMTAKQWNVQFKYFSLTT